MANVRPLTDTMRAILRFAAEEKSLYTLCLNRSEYGARTGSILALRRRGLLRGHELTDEGRAALKSTSPGGEA